MPRIFETLLSLFFPRRCPFCGHPVATNEHVCKACSEKLPFVTGETCPHCGRGREYCRCANLNFEFEGCAAPFYYEGIVRRGIINFKFYARQTSASAYANYAAEAVKRMFAGKEFDFVSCVPLSHAEHRKRGFNQSELFARALANELSLSYREALVKPRDVSPQRKLPAKERWSNVSGAFRAASPLHGERVLLADDIITTGATLSDSARALKSAGAGSVYCAVIACVKFDGGTNKLTDITASSSVQ